MGFVKKFQDLSKKDVAIAGGKGASLGEMTQAGIPVPEGFVVLSNAFENFIKKNDLSVEIDAILDSVDTDKMHTIENASEKIQALILNSEIPKEIEKAILSEFKKLKTDFVAVRSSATSEDSADAAWAGQLDSFLNTTKDNLVENVKKCWASLFTPRAIFYRFEKKLHKEKVSVAVVIQKMVDSEESGIAFSVHPVTEDENQLIIEAGFGLGEAIVSGQITPDAYVFDKKDSHIIDKNVDTQAKGLYRNEAGGNDWKEIDGKRQVLTDDEIVELSKLVIKIEEHYGFPVDIEWAMEKGKFYIVQSRPITTLMKKEKNEPIKLLSRYLVRERPFCDFRLWYDSNCVRIKEILNEGIETLVCVREAGSNKTAMYYDMSEIAEKFKILAGMIVTEKDFMEKIEKRFRTYWEEVKPYAQDGKKLKNMAELKDYIQNLTELWVATIVYWVVPQIPQLPEKVRKSSLKNREILENISDARSIAIVNFVKDNFLEYKDIADMMLPEEIYILEKRKLNKKEIEKIKQREKGALMINGEEYLIEDLEKELSKRRFELEKLEASSQEKLMGQTACKGNVTGRVKLILYKNQIDEIKEGDILVSEMTTPDHVPAMKKAAAIITDEGGVVCHAAIVAREMNKPCIIGTRVATKTLKDGDLVEVDADNGIIRILKKNEPIKLTKRFSREHSLFYLYNFAYTNMNGAEKVLGKRMDNLLYLYDPKHSQVSSWFDMKRYAELCGLLAVKARGDKDFYKKVEEEFNGHWEKIEPYIKKKKKVKSIEELKKFHENVINFYESNIIIYVSPEIEALPKENRELCQKLREKVQEHVNDIDDVFLDFFNKSYPEYESISHYILPAEVFELEKGPLPKEKLAELEKRKEEGCFLLNCIIHKFKDLKKVLKDNNLVMEGYEKDVSGIKEFNGQIAFKGKVKGIVKVIYLIKDLPEVQKGNILVAAMTMPKYLPAIKKAGAIVTDEGGITCHAAIISRELAKPCIIGTKIATRVLKDGMKVEVDADNGIVKILEKAK